MFIDPASSVDENADYIIPPSREKVHSKNVEIKLDPLPDFSDSLINDPIFESNHRVNFSEDKSSVV